MEQEARKPLEEIERYGEAWKIAEFLVCTRKSRAFVFGV